MGYVTEAKNTVKQIFDFAIGLKKYDYNPALYAEVPKSEKKKQETKIIDDSTVNIIRNFKHPIL